MANEVSYEELKLLQESLLDDRKLLNNEQLARLGIQHLINNFSVGLVGAVIGFGQLVLSSSNNPKATLELLLPVYPILSIMMSAFALAFTEQERMISSRYNLEKKIRKALQDVSLVNQKGHNETKSQEKIPEVVSLWKQAYQQDEKRLKGVINGILSLAKLAPTLGLSIILIILEPIIRGSIELTGLWVLSIFFAVMAFVLVAIVGRLYFAAHD